MIILLVYVIISILIGVIEILLQILDILKMFGGEDICNDDMIVLLCVILFITD